MFTQPQPPEPPQKSPSFYSPLPPQPPKTCKNFPKLAIISFVITLSSFYFGFSLTYLGTIPKPTLAKYYGNAIYRTTTLPILTGAMPVGGIFGSLIANVVMRYFTRRKLLIGINVLALVNNAVIQVTNIWVLLICRFITGILVGIYMGIVPSYVKQLSPHRVSGIFGSFTQLQHLVGNVVSYLFATFFYLGNFQGDFFMRFQLEFTTLLIALQLVLLVTGYIPESPNSLLLEGRDQDAREVLRMFHQEAEIQGVVGEKIEENRSMRDEVVVGVTVVGEHGMVVGEDGVVVGVVGDDGLVQRQMQETRSIKYVGEGNSMMVKQQLIDNPTQQANPNQMIDDTNKNNNLNDTYIVQFTPPPHTHTHTPQPIQMNWKSYFLSFQLPLTQQFTGTNFIVTQMTAITAIYDVGLSHFTGLMANGIQLVATCFSAYLLARFGRRTIILAGNFSIGVLDIVIGGVFLALKENWAPGFALGMSLIMLFNILYGLTLGPTIWLYIPQIAKKRVVPLATATYWIGCSICVTVPPIITTNMNSPYAVFLFFGMYELLMFLPNYLLVLETKGLTAREISYKFLNGYER